MAVADIEQTPQEPAASIDARRMFKYSEFIDVGDGAAECEHARDGQCEDIEHFHAWCRLPNSYQHQDIRAKGLAAKARQIRALRDPESDDSVVLDQQLAGLDDEVFLDAAIEELLRSDFAEDYLEAQRDVEEREEFEHITQDREEYTRQSATEAALTEDEQSEEYKRLSAHMRAYLDAIEQRLGEVQKPKRAELRARPHETLMELIRAKRVDAISDRAFIETYNAWMWFIGTFRVELHPTLGRPHLPMWAEIGLKDRPAAGTMFGEAPEVLDVLRSTFDNLQVALQRGSAGN